MKENSERNREFSVRVHLMWTEAKMYSDYVK